MHRAPQDHAPRPRRALSSHPAAALLAALGLVTGCAPDVPRAHDGDALDTSEVTTGDDADGRDLLDDAPTADADIGAPTACLRDADCAFVTGCCFSGACAGGTCVARATPDCCAALGPCATTTLLHTAECVDTCVMGGCEQRLALSGGACGELWRLDVGADDVLSSLAVVDPAADRVTWHSSARRPFGGHPSLHAGDVLCPTYHTGPLDADCRPRFPSLPANTVTLTLTTPPVALPGDAPSVARAWLWMDLEDPEARGGAFDGLEIAAVGASGRVLTGWSSRTAETPRATWFPALIDLSAFAGDDVRLRVTFDTRDGVDNDHEGVYLGALELGTPCGTARECPAPSGCAVGRLAAVAGTADALCVIAPPDVSRACVPCEDDGACAALGPCGRCGEGGVCAPDPTCCDPAEALTADPSFEGGALPAGWEASEPAEAEAARWHLSTWRAATGLASLRFGEPAVARTAPPGMAASGSVISPPVRVPAGDPALAFSLWLSTEFDGAPDPDNPAGVDLLEVTISVDTPLGALLPAVVVWDSRALGGTTDGAWERVTVPLAGYAGQIVRLGWAFQTGDAQNNGAEGVYLDDVSLAAGCARSPPPEPPAPMP